MFSNGVIVYFSVRHTTAKREQEQLEQILKTNTCTGFLIFKQR